jgi:hypothetical protein
VLRKLLATAVRRLLVTFVIASLKFGFVSSDTFRHWWSTSSSYVLDQTMRVAYSAKATIRTAEPCPEIWVTDPLYGSGVVYSGQGTGKR